MRSVKCQACGDKSQINQMECEEHVTASGNKTRKYFHKGVCWQKRLEHKAFLEKENLELDELVETIKQVHNIDMIPQGIYPLLQDLRNGEYGFGQRKKIYKEGFTYSLISDTYKFVEKDIVWAKKNKSFDGLGQELRYCLAIVKDKILKVKKKKEQIARQVEADMLKEKQRIQSEVNMNERKVQFKSKKHKADISAFLD
ncbi:hypothetical protein M5X17_27945 [Paenibacillus alvei]|uniref:hypothetical protein n=1 Tax=Paenibacillus alvei TaxID=44250 RepID=UPI00227DCDA4|nr:hypothetical protein [Paenibacillus alvei]MCY9737540.1 hypothetical protein [Paenibacillus alvei]